MPLRMRSAASAKTKVIVAIALGVLSAGCTRAATTAASDAASTSATTSSGGTTPPRPSGMPATSAGVPANPSTPGFPPALGLIDDLGSPVDAGARPLLQAVHQAAARHDIDRLVQLCAPCADKDFAQTQRALLVKAGTLDMLLRVLSTHTASTDGYTYPGFALAGFQSRYDLADAATLSYPNPHRSQTPPSDYRGLWTFFESTDVTDPWTWTGISFR